MDLETLIIYCFVKGPYNYNIWKQPKKLSVFPQDSIFVTFRRNPKNIKVFSKGDVYYNV
jgi:hypothetical protein